jgi:hypothetical protein
MAKVVIRCQYTGHYVFTGIDAETPEAAAGGRIFCPYCAAEHSWGAAEVRLDAKRPNPLVRQAG